MEYNHPGKTIAEITLIGTGGGYGESCVIHYGDNNWAVVDSCINPHSKVSLPLEYLNSLGVNIETNVKLILCTHWHNDHILGLSQIVSKCKNSIFCFGKATDRQKFLKWVSLDYLKLEDETSISSTNEFVKCLDIAKAYRMPVKLVDIDKTLVNLPEIGASIISLSPSDFTCQQFDEELSTLMKEYVNPTRKYIASNPNDKSVVLLLQLGNHVALLGADLEVSGHPQKGWESIMNDSVTIKGKKATLFKIPHHGSENGYHSQVWEDLLGLNPISKLTPWNLNTGLPVPDMIQLYLSKTEKLYITSPHGVKSNKAKTRDRGMEKIINFFNKTVKEVKFTKGIIRSRIDMSNPESTWDVELDGTSLHLNSVI